MKRPCNKNDRALRYYLYVKVKAATRAVSMLPAQSFLSFELGREAATNEFDLELLYRNIARGACKYFSRIFIHDA